MQKEENLNQNLNSIFFKKKPKEPLDEYKKRMVEYITANKLLDNEYLEKEIRRRKGKGCTLLIDYVIEHNTSSNQTRKQSIRRVIERNFPKSYEEISKILDYKKVKKEFETEKKVESEKIDKSKIEYSPFNLRDIIGDYKINSEEKREKKEEQIIDDYDEKESGNLNNYISFGLPEMKEKEEKDLF